MNYLTMFKKGGMAIFTFVVAYLASNPQIWSYFIPENILNMTVGSMIAALLVMLSNWMKNKDRPKDAVQK